MVTSAIADMRDIVSWLKHIEELVGKLYAMAAETFADDGHFSRFLAQLSEDEKSHAGFMSMFAEFLRKRESPLISDVALDERIRERVETPLQRFWFRFCQHRPAMLPYIPRRSTGRSCRGWDWHRSGHTPCTHDNNISRSNPQTPDNYIRQRHIAKGCDMEVIISGNRGLSCAKTCFSGLTGRFHMNC